MALGVLQISAILYCSTTCMIFLAGSSICFSYTTACLYILQMGPLPKEVLSERDGCLSEPITRANYLEKLFLLTEWEQHSHMEALEKYVHNMHGAHSYSINKVQLSILLCNF